MTLQLRASIAKTADRHDHRNEMLGAMLFSSLMAVIFYPCVVVNCISSAVVDLFVCGGPSKRYPNPTTLFLLFVCFALTPTDFQLTYFHSSNSSG